MIPRTIQSVVWVMIDASFVYLTDGSVGTTGSTFPTSSCDDGCLDGGLIQVGGETRGTPSM